jgi:hypothetical protein
MGLKSIRSSMTVVTSYGSNIRQSCFWLQSRFAERFQVTAAIFKNSFG